MAGETPYSDNDDELRMLWDASPASDGISEEAEDFLLAQRAAEGEEPSAEFNAKMATAIGNLAAMNASELDEMLADAKKNTPFAKYMRELLDAVSESSTVSPVPYHRSVTAGNAGGFTQSEWDALPESTKRLHRKDDEPDNE